MPICARTCTKCGKLKNLDEFKADSRGKYGKRSWCKFCEVQYTKEWRRRNPEKAKEASKRAYYRHREDRIRRVKKWCKQNPGKKAINKKRSERKARLTIEGRIRDNLRGYLWRALKKNKGGKSSQEILGYTIKELIKHLRKTVPSGHTWQDFIDGKLQIDHIIPQSVFNFRGYNDIDFRRCWALDNLRLLPSRENAIKSDMLSAPFQPSLAFGDKQNANRICC